MAQAPAQATLQAPSHAASAPSATLRKSDWWPASAAVIALVVVAFLWARTPEYRVLYSNLSDRDGGDVIAALSHPERSLQASPKAARAILVPAPQVYEMRLKLASQGLPKGGAVGFELMDKQKFGMSQFEEQVNYPARARRRAGAHDPVDVAGADRARASGDSASHRVRARAAAADRVGAGEPVSRPPLDAAQVSAIQHLVASSVPELMARDVTVVDQDGNLLSATGERPRRRPRCLAAQVCAQPRSGHPAASTTFCSRSSAATTCAPRSPPTSISPRSSRPPRSTSPTRRPEQSLRSQQTIETTSSPSGPAACPARSPTSRPERRMHR